MILPAGKLWHVEQADCLEWLRALPPDSLDLVFGSPPYEQARLYLEGGEDLGVSRKTDAWVAWMVEVYAAAQRACKGLVAFVVAGQTRKFKWSAGPALLMAELHRAGMNLRNPPIFSRVGIPGSGGPDWLRSDYEWIVCTSRPGKLPWSDNTACGHPPKWAPGGEMSHRVSDGARVNQWGHSVESGATVVEPDGVVRSEGKRPSHKLTCNSSTRRRRGTDERENFERLRIKGGSPKNSICEANREKWCGRKKGVGVATRGGKNGDTQTGDGYDPPTLANPGNQVEQSYTFTAKQLAELLGGEASDIQRHLVGGGMMGHDLAHLNEAPFPVDLASFVVRSFCPPGGIVGDPFAGSGTTLHAAIENGRRGVGCDLRASQVELSRRRLSGVTPCLM